MSFWAELRRRNVIRVAGGYAVVAWLLVQIAVVFEEAMSLPAWFDGVVVALLLLGLPIALILAWAFELTPEGVRAAASPAPGTTPRPVSPLDIAFLLAFVVVVGISVVQLVGPAATAPTRAATVATDIEPRPANASLAVLPFTDLSPEGDQAYFAEGLSEELMTQLYGIENLDVAGRTSSFSFRDRSASFEEIGARLGVASLLDGSVRKAGDRVRINVQLINVADGFPLWAESYDRDLVDVFAIQEEIAQEVADRLSVTLGVGDQSYGGTTNLDAYDEYLMGRALRVQANRLPEAAEALRHATRIDPGYARAWADLAITLAGWRVIAIERAAEIDAEREIAMRTALEIAPDLPRALVSKAWLHVDRREWLDGYRVCERVFAGPPDAEAEFLCAGLWTEVGAVRAALPYREAGARADPLSDSVSLTLSRQYLLLDDRDGFEREVERSRREIGNVPAHDVWRLVQLLDEHAPLAEILEVQDRACLPANVEACAEGRAILESSADDARQMLVDRLARQRETIPWQAHTTAWLAAYYGENALALEAWRVFDPVGAGAFYQTIWAPLFSEMRQLPEFKTFVEDAGFLEVWRETGDWGDYCRPVGANDFECA
jgi:TolB-like protein